MRPTTVKVPASLLSDRRLPASAKFLWLIRQLITQDTTAVLTPGLLQARSGLARETVRYGLANLASAGWFSSAKADDQRKAAALLPSDLLLDRRVGVNAKVLYGGLQLTPRFRGGVGITNYPELSELVGLSEKPVRSATRDLAAHGWLQVRQRTKFCPIQFTLRNPLEDRRKAEVISAELRLSELNNRGEAIMREYLSLIVESDEFEDNASPGFLVNPYTAELLQFDRYYPPSVAFEFNGDQHYGPTELYPDVAEAWKQQGRDLIKTGICAKRGITLVVVHPEDLSLATLRQKVSGLLPIRNLDDHEPLLTFLERVSRGYRRKAQQGREAAARRRQA